MHGTTIGTLNVYLKHLRYLGQPYFTVTNGNDFSFKLYVLVWSVYSKTSSLNKHCNLSHSVCLVLWYVPIFGFKLQDFKFITLYSRKKGTMSVVDLAMLSGFFKEVTCSIPYHLLFCYFSYVEGEVSISKANVKVGRCVFLCISLL